MKKIDEGQSAKVQESIMQAARAAEAMEQLAEASLLHAKAAEATARTAVDHVRIAELAFLAAKRPWLVVEASDQDTDLVHETGPTFTYDVVNYGNSPAIIRDRSDAVIRLNRRITEHDVDNRFSFIIDRNVIPSGERRRFQAAFDSRASFEEALDGSYLPIYAVGKIDYEGVNGLRHETRFCWIHHTDSGTFYETDNPPGLNRRT